MIKRFRVASYKSIAWGDVQLEPVTVFIGRSGTGKTNFVESIRFLRDLLFKRNLNSLAHNEYGGVPRVISATAPLPTNLRFEVWFDAPGMEQDFQYTLSFRCETNHSFSHPEEKLTLGDRPVFHQANAKWEVTPAMVNPPPAGEIRLGALTGLMAASIAYISLTKAIGWYAFSEQVLLQPTQNGRSEDTGLADNASNYLRAYSTFLHDLQSWEQHREIIAALQRLNPAIRSVDVQMPGVDRIVVGHALGEKIFDLDLSQESEGFRRFLACLMALYQHPSKQTLIFEEPEKGIYPGALGVLAEQILACPQERRGQIILTTHSPELLNHFPPQSLRVVEMNDRHETVIGSVASDQFDAIREQLLWPGELLTVDLARTAEAGVISG